MVYITLAAILALAYILLQLYYLSHWMRIPDVVVPEQYIPSVAISIVVVAHNEEDSIEACLQSILHQDYPAQLSEIIVINDRSVDRTAEVLDKQKSSRVRVFHLSEHPDFIHPPAYKKSGIELAVHQSGNDWIIVTDADCTHTPGWLKTISFVKENSDSCFLTAPVQIKSNANLLTKMQDMENLALMVVTAAGIKSGLHDIANGANMSFSKKAFKEIGGYTGNYQFASGDDMFLIEKMRAHFPGQIAFVKSYTAQAITAAKESWNELLKQRIRWAGKNKGLQSPWISMIWLFIGVYHTTLILSLFLPLFTNISWQPFIILWISKGVIDFVILFSSSFFFRKRKLLTYFIPLQLMYIFYTLLLGCLLLIGRKGDWQDIAPAE